MAEAAFAFLILNFDFNKTAILTGYRLPSQQGLAIADSDARDRRQPGQKCLNPDSRDFKDFEIFSI
jgi:hypothetical protein